jgi:hypothetical protein
LTCSTLCIVWIEFASVSTPSTMSKKIFIRIVCIIVCENISMTVVSMLMLVVHCIEQVRQYIMCAGDMTPVPTRYNEARKHSYVDSDVTHTCRNFGQLRDWLTERYNGSLAVKPICPGATKPEMGSTSCVLDE